MLHFVTIKYSLQQCDKTVLTKMTIHSLFTVHMLQPFHAFSNMLDLTEAEQSIYQNVQYFIWSKKSVFHFTAVRYSLHKCSETILWLKRQFTEHVSLVSCAIKFTEARKNLPPSSYDLNLVNSLLWTALQQKLYRQDLRDVDCLTHVLLHCWVR